MAITSTVHYIRYRAAYSDTFGPLEAWPTMKQIEQQIQRRSGLRDGSTWTRYIDADGFAISVFGEVPGSPTAQMELWPNRAYGDAPKDGEEAEALLTVSPYGGVMRFKLRDRAPRPLLEVLSDSFGAEVRETTAAGKVLSLT